MKFKLYILSFCVVIFLLTAIGLGIVYSGDKFLGFWSIFIYVIVLSCTYAFLVQPLLTGERKLSGKKIVLLTFGVTILGAIVTHSVWTVITPKWSFSVTTDKSTYILGDDVKITASLRNLGFITHSFMSALSDPVLISIEYQYTENPTVTPRHGTVHTIGKPQNSQLDLTNLLKKLHLESN